MANHVTNVDKINKYIANLNFRPPENNPYAPSSNDIAYGALTAPQAQGEVRSMANEMPNLGIWRQMEMEQNRAPAGGEISALGSPQAPPQNAPPASSPQGPAPASMPMPSSISLKSSSRGVPDPKFNPWDIKDPDISKLQAAQSEAIAEQRKMMAMQQMNIGRIADSKPQDNLAPMLGLVDQWTGSKMAQNYKAPESGEQKLSKVQALENGLMNQQNVLTDNQLGQLKAALADKKDARDTLIRYQMHKESMANANSIANMKMDGKSGKLISPAQIAEMAALKEQGKNIDSNYEDWKKMARPMGSSVMGLFPNTQANIYMSKRIQPGTNFGKAMLGSARSLEMINKHIAMFPSSSDSDEKALEKVTQNKQAAVDKYNEKLSAFRDGGYDVSHLKPLTVADMDSYSSMPSREEMIKKMNGG